jgi:hypothetical protein
LQASRSARVRQPLPDATIACNNSARRWHGS